MGLWGKTFLLNFVRNTKLGPVGARTDFGRWSFYFEPEAPPIGPDFRFNFEEDHEGAISVNVEGSYRYEGFSLHAGLTRAGTRDAREDWPTPSLIVSAESGPMLSVTRHAKRLRDFFITNYSAKDYDSMFKAWRK
jgi:hypothetical protein